MFKDCRVFTTLPVSDPARARRFYAEKLGLRPTQPDGDYYECRLPAGWPERQDERDDPRNDETHRALRPQPACRV